MPEGHLLHRLARDQGTLVGPVIQASSPQGRFAEGAAALHGRTLVAVEAHGKHLHHCVQGATPVETWTADGRTAYACPTCQPR